MNVQATVDLLPPVEVCLPYILNSNCNPNPVHRRTLQCCRANKYNRILGHKGSGFRRGRQLVWVNRVGSAEKAVAVRFQPKFQLVRSTQHKVYRYRLLRQWHQLHRPGPGRIPPPSGAQWRVLSKARLHPDNDPSLVGIMPRE